MFDTCAITTINVCTIWVRNFAIVSDYLARTMGLKYLSSSVHCGTDLIVLFQRFVFLTAERLSRPTFLETDQKYSPDVEKIRTHLQQYTNTELLEGLHNFDTATTPGSCPQYRVSESSFYLPSNPPLPCLLG